MKILHILYDDILNPWAHAEDARRALEINRRLAAQGAQITMVTGNFPMAGGEPAVEGIRFLRVGDGTSPRRSRRSFAAAAPMLIQTVAHDLLVQDLSPRHPVDSRDGPAPARVGIVHRLVRVRPLPLCALRGLLLRRRERRLLRAFGCLIATAPDVAERLRAQCRPGTAVELVCAGAEPDWDEVAQRQRAVYEGVVRASAPRGVDAATA